jgi:hypothetical protein
VEASGPALANPLNLRNNGVRTHKNPGKLTGTFGTEIKWTPQTRTSTRSVSLRGRPDRVVFCNG